MTIYEQADTATDTPIGARYSWLLSGIKHNSAYGRQLERSGWKWITGRPGCFVTNDPDLAAKQATRSGCEIKTNGTHAALDLPTLLCDPRTV